MNKGISQLIKTTLLSVLFSSILIGATAQEGETAEKEIHPFLKGVDITGSVGLNHFWGDIRQFDYWPVWTNENENQLGYGLSAHKEIFDAFTAGIKLNAGKLQGTQRSMGNMSVYFNTYIFESSLDFNYNLLSLIKVKSPILNNKTPRFKKLFALATLSTGMINYNSQVYRKSNLGVTEYSNGSDRGSSGKTNKFVLSYGLWIQYHVAEHWNIGLETSLRNVFDDQLDGWNSEGSANDKYTLTAVTASYIFTRKEELLVKPAEPAAVAAVPEPEVVEEPEEIEEPEVEVTETAPVTPTKPAIAKLDFSDDIVFFDVNSTIPAEALVKKIESIANKLKAHPEVKIELIGHADKSGSDEFNKKISLKRAEVVRNLLVNKFKIASNRITVHGKGETEAKNADDPLSRRVEVIQVN